MLHNIFGIAHARILVTQPHAMCQHAIAQGPIRLGKPVRLCCHLGKAHARPDQVDIRHHMLIRHLVEGALLVTGGHIANNPAARNITAIAVRADQIGIKRHHVAFLHDARTAFLKPRVGAGA